MECLYSLIEMTQFQDWLMDNDTNETISHKDKEEYRYNRIIFPSNVPISEMLSGKDVNVEIITQNMYEKYVKTGSEYEINISYTLRNQFSEIIVQQIERHKEQDWLNELMDVLDKCNHANKTLLMYSLTRFKHSDDFDQVRKILQDDGQLQITTN